MVLLSLAFPDGVCGENSIYFRTDGIIEGSRIALKPGQFLSTDTYMNAFDMGFWHMYTGIRKPFFEFKVSGRAKVRILVKKGPDTVILSEKTFESGIHAVDIPEITDGLVFFYIKAEEELYFEGGSFSENTAPPRDIRLALDTVTFRRNKQFAAGLKKFTESAFFNKEDSHFGSLRIYAVDNGDDFKPEFSHEFIKLFKNSNKGGGSGGFARGLEEIKKDKAFAPTHVVFMDDDVLLQNECFMRLYAFLSYVKEEFAQNPVAGRMFCLDNRKVQYTAAENWNMADLMHLEGNLDMSLAENVLEESGATGEYGGWWLCAYPASFALNNRPFPFFLHCDDAEYGLRCGKRALILRGFGVWHETADRRSSPAAAYYDARNSFILNMMEEPKEEAPQVIARWRALLDFYHSEGRYAEKYLCAAALMDALKAEKVLKKYGQIPEGRRKKAENETFAKIAGALLRRIAQKKAAGKYERVREEYVKVRKELGA